jgi:hypothetical protein
MTSIDGVRKLLLISNSTLHGGGYLDHAEKGDLHHALDAGVVTRADVHADLGEIVAERRRAANRKKRSLSLTARAWLCRTLRRRPSCTKKPSGKGPAFG